jgi:anti-sigma factor RsiW
MAADSKSHDTVARINALIDGELPPSEHAALAAHIASGRDLANAHATLARLKAVVVESAEQTPVDGIVLPQAARKRIWPLAAAGALAATVLVAAFVWKPWERPAEPAVAVIGRVITLAALPAAPVIPDLDNAGLKLVGGEVERASGTSVLVAAYRGPRGCRVELRVWPSTAVMPPTGGTSRQTWTAGPLTYELVAFGMPSQRFDAVVMAAQAATRRSAPQDALVREASLQAPPCTG